MRHVLLLPFVAASLLGGCRIDTLSNEEAQAALEESSVDSQAAALTSASVEISTDFTIGDAAQRAAEHIRDFVQSQLPCADVSLQDATLTIEYGARPGNCTFRGHQFAGTQTISVEKNADDEVVVEHVWKDFNNGRVSVSGDAEVTWNAKDPSRHVTHDLSWTRLSDGRTGHGSGDRTQRPLDGGLIEGFEVDGSRVWEGKRGRWDLDIDHVEMRWADPVPQAGSLVLQTPFDKTVTLEFERIDANTIGVNASAGARSVELKVGKLGAVSRR
jgi:hypothetical protein